MNSFNSAVCELREAEKLIPDCISNIDIQKHMSKFMEVMQNASDKEKADFMNSAMNFSMIPKKTLAQTLDKAASHIEEACKEAKIIFQDGSVEFEYMGSGSFGHAFNVSFKDGNNEKVLHDKTIKLYKDDEVEQECTKINLQKTKEYIENMSFEDYWKMVKEFTVKMQINIAKTLGTPEEDIDMEEIENLVDSTKPYMEGVFAQLKEGFCNISLEGLFAEVLNAANDIHGCLPEANRALFINKANNKNLKETNYIEPHYFDVKNRFAFMETADDELPQVKKEVDLSKIGLLHGDVGNINNTVANRVIDYGGILKTTETGGWEEDF